MTHYTMYTVITLRTPHYTLPLLSTLEIRRNQKHKESDLEVQLHTHMIAYR